MAKLTFLFAAMAPFLLVAATNASIYRTTVVVEDDEGNPERRGQSCQEQIQSQHQLRQCQMFIRHQSQQEREREQPPYYGGRGSEEGDNEAHCLRECCQQLEKLPTRCRCEGLEQAFRTQSQQGQMEGQRLREMYDVARRVPSMCRIQPMQCQFGGPRFWY